MRPFNFTPFLRSASLVKSSVQNSVSEATERLRGAKSIEEVDAVLSTFYNAALPVQFLRLVAVENDVRSSASDAMAQIEQFELRVAQNKELYNVVRNEVVDHNDVEKERAKFLYLRDFELLGGQQLSEENQSRLLSLRNRVVELEATFQKNIADDNTKVQFRRDELEGLDEAFLNSLEQSNAEQGGKKLFTLTLQYPHVTPVMQLCKREETRKCMSLTNSMKAYPVNEPVLAELVKLRKDIATLLGYESDTQLALARAQRMIGEDPAEVDRFLDRMATLLKPKLDKEFAALFNVKTDAVSHQKDGTLYPWNVEFLRNLVKKQQYDIDNELVKEYFPLDVVLRGVMQCYSTLLNVKFERDPEAEAIAWHPEVMAYRVYDSDGTTFLSRFYLDLHPRPGKYSHAACWFLGKRGASPENRGTVCMVTNFTAATADRPALLRFAEVETLFHEFGHVCHACLSNNRFQRLNWTWKAVEMDFLEVPSMSFEKFIYDPEILKVLSKHYISGESLPEQLRVSLVRARNAFEASAWTRLISMAKFDLALHSPNPPPVGEWSAISAENSRRYLGYTIPEDCIRPSWASFYHMGSGYNSSYYSYLWAEVRACAIFELFKKGGFLNPELGMRLRKTVLEPCTRKPAAELLRDILGREPTEEPFRESIFEDA